MGSDGLPQPQPEPAVGPLEFVPDEVAVDLLDGDDQELLLSVGRLFTISLRNATQKIDNMDFSHLSMAAKPPCPRGQGGLPALALVLLGILGSISDPDLDWIRIRSGKWTQIRIQKGKNYRQKYKKVKKLGISKYQF